MDTITIVVLVILLIAFGVFIGTQVAGGDAQGSDGNSYSSYPIQYAGGGCGR